MVRDADFVPIPHGALQADHAPHSDSEQPTGHGDVLQSSTLRSDPHVVATSAGVVHPVHATERVLVSSPVPHALLHTPLAIQEPSVQVGAQRSVLHGSVFVSAGHGAPAPAGERVMLRVYWSTPPPHVAEQPASWVHGDTSQSVSHACVLQVRSSTVPPHTCSTV